MTAPDEPDRTRQSHFGLISSAVALFAPLLYVLSLGPVVWLARREFLSESASATLEMFYLPVFWAMRHSVLIDKCVSWYVNWWLP